MTRKVVFPGWDGKFLISGVEKRNKRREKSLAFPLYKSTVVTYKFMCDSCSVSDVVRVWFLCHCLHDVPGHYAAARRTGSLVAVQQWQFPLQVVCLDFIVHVYNVRECCRHAAGYTSTVKHRMTPVISGVFRGGLYIHLYSPFLVDYWNIQKWTDRQRLDRQNIQYYSRKHIYVYTYATYLRTLACTQNNLLVELTL